MLQALQQRWFSALARRACLALLAATCLWPAAAHAQLEPLPTFTSPAPTTNPEPVAAQQTSPLWLPGGWLSGPPIAGNSSDGGNAVGELPEGSIVNDTTPGEPYTWQVCPGSLIWHSYMAGTKESCFRSVWSNINGIRVWDVALGGRVGIWRYGDTSNIRPQGWQMDIEGAALPRLFPQLDSSPLVACDYRFGLQQTYGCGNFIAKFGYYHLSSHLGDEYMLMFPSAVRINYVRDSGVLALGYYLTPEIRIYGEIAYAFGAEDGAEPLEFQSGVEYSPIRLDGRSWAPFAALNVHSFQELDFGGNIVLQAGIQWRPGAQGRRFRLGAQYYDGYNEQLEFFAQREHKLSFGIWYDF